MLLCIRWQRFWHIPLFVNSMYQSPAMHLFDLGTACSASKVALRRLMMVLQACQGRSREKGNGWCNEVCNDAMTGKWREKKEENLTSQNRSHNFHGWGLSWLLTSISKIFGWCEQIRWLSWGLKEKIAQLMRYSARRWFQIFFLFPPLPGGNFCSLTWIETSNVCLFSLSNL